MNNFAILSRWKFNDGFSELALRNTQWWPALLENAQFAPSQALWQQMASSENKVKSKDLVNAIKLREIDTTTLEIMLQNPDFTKISVLKALFAQSATSEKKLILDAVSAPIRRKILADWGRNYDDVRLLSEADRVYFFTGTQSFMGLLLRTEELRASDATSEEMYAALIVDFEDFYATKPGGIDLSWLLCEVINQCGPIGALRCAQPEMPFCLRKAVAGSRFVTDEVLASLLEVSGDKTADVKVAKALAWNKILLPKQLRYLSEHLPEGSRVNPESSVKWVSSDRTSLNFPIEDRERNRFINSVQPHYTGGQPAYEIPGDPTSLIAMLEDPEFEIEQDLDHRLANAAASICCRPLPERLWGAYFQKDRDSEEQIEHMEACEQAPASYEPPLIVPDPNKQMFRFGRLIDSYNPGTLYIEQQLTTAAEWEIFFSLISTVDEIEAKELVDTVKAVLA